MSWLNETDKEKQLIKWYLKHEIDSIKLIKIKLIRWNEMNFLFLRPQEGLLAVKKNKSNYTLFSW